MALYSCVGRWTTPMRDRRAMCGTSEGTRQSAQPRGLRADHALRDAQRQLSAKR